MFDCKFYSYYIFFIGFLIVGWSVQVQSESCVFVPINTDMNTCEEDEDSNDIAKQMQDIVCPFPSLKEAMADERMAQIIAGNNVFSTIESNDVVRLKKGVGLYVALNPLKTKINKTYKNFYKVAQADFTLNITTYPAETQEGTCANHSTIIKKSTPKEEQESLEELETLLTEDLEQRTETLGVKREISGVFGDYSTVDKIDPRHFELRKNQDGDIFICEASKISLKERVSLYCGNSNNDECKGQMPPLCLEWDQENSQASTRQNICSSLSAFEKVSGDFFMNNMTMNEFCPEDCSYYVQLLQRVRKEEDGHCAESHAIVHCGPRKTEAKYNLNIKVVDDFCEDFNVMCVPPTQVVSK